MIPRALAVWLVETVAAVANALIDAIPDRTFDAHVADELAVAAPDCCCLWTPDELVQYAPDLAELDGVQTYDDFVYAICHPKETP